MNEAVIHATQKVPRVNSQFERMTERSNPQMRPWYSLGAQAIHDQVDVNDRGQ
jgi:hypothetical protein